MVCLQCLDLITSVLQMITEFFAMLSQNLSSRKVSFIEVVGEFFTFLLDPGLVDIGLSSGRNCLLRDRGLWKRFRTKSSTSFTC